MASARRLSRPAAQLQLASTDDDNSFTQLAEMCRSAVSPAAAPPAAASETSGEKRPQGRRSLMERGVRHTVYRGPPPVRTSRMSEERLLEVRAKRAAEGGAGGARSGDDGGSESDVDDLFAPEQVVTYSRKREQRQQQEERAAHRRTQSLLLFRPKMHTLGGSHQQQHSSQQAASRPREQKQQLDLLDFVEEQEEELERAFNRQLTGTLGKPPPAPPKQQHPAKTPPATPAAPKTPRAAAPATTITSEVIAPHATTKAQAPKAPAAAAPTPLREKTRSGSNSAASPIFLDSQDVVTLLDERGEATAQPLCTYLKDTPCSITVTRGDMERLRPDGFLNDTLIEFYMTYLAHEVVPRRERSSYLFCSPFLTSAVLERDSAKLARWRSTVADMQHKAFVVMPINWCAHWVLAIACLRADVFADVHAPCVLFFDSLGCVELELDAVVHWLASHAWPGAPREAARVRTITMRRLPRQQNGSDCGVFVLHYAECFITRRPRTLAEIREHWFSLREIRRKRQHIRDLLCRVDQNGRIASSTRLGGGDGDDDDDDDDDDDVEDDDGDGKETKTQKEPNSSSASSVSSISSASSSSSSSSSNNNNNNNSDNKKSSTSEQQGRASAESDSGSDSDSEVPTHIFTEDDDVLEMLLRGTQSQSQHSREQKDNAAEPPPKRCKTSN